MPIDDGAVALEDGLAARLVVGEVGVRRGVGPAVAHVDEADLGRRDVPAQELADPLLGRRRREMQEGEAALPLERGELALGLRADVPAVDQVLAGDARLGRPGARVVEARRRELDAADAHAVEHADRLGRGGRAAEPDKGEPQRLLAALLEVNVGRLDAVRVERLEDPPLADGHGHVADDDPVRRRRCGQRRGGLLGVAVLAGGRPRCERRACKRVSVLLATRRGRALGTA